MSDHGWGIPHVILDQASPFHMVLGPDLTVRQVGSSLSRLCPSITPGRTLEDVVELVSPRVPFALESFRSRARSLFLLKVRGAELTLRGQMLYDVAADVTIFMGAPWITSLSTVGEMGMTLEDFAVSDNIVDYLLLLQTQETALAQARTLADSLHLSAAELSHQASHDDLTGLPNRRLLADRFGQALRAEQRVHTRTGLLVIDLDGFKQINDTFGHQHGDDLLVQVGARLAGPLRKVDTVARLGGDEFAILLPDLHTVADAMTVAHKIRAALEVPFTIAGLDLEVEASVGVVLSGEHGQTADLLLRHADIAMYSAKVHGIGVSAYDPETDGSSPARLVLQGDLRRAMQQEELVLHYQPKISVRDGRVLGVEALVRWQHPTRGLIMPADFIPVAELSGLIGALSCHILNAALIQAHAWAGASRPLAVSVNISARNLLDENLPQTVAALIALHGVPAELLVLEVTETAMMTDPSRAQRVLEELAGLGVRISIDDFGAGYTSLGHLTTMPISELKIDASFVSAMTRDPGSAQVVQSIITLGHNLGLTIVAEGVETEQALELLARLGCDSAQGYHLSPPLATDAFDVWAEQNRSLLPVYEHAPS